MARAFGLVEGRFCELYGVKEPRFLASYVPGSCRSRTRRARPAG